MKSRYLAAVNNKHWWLAGGIPTNWCVAAYQAKGASSLAASYTNLANPGVYTLEAGAAPDWTVTDGWDCINLETNRYLWTGITPENNQKWSMVARFDNSINASSQTLAGCMNTAGSSSNFYLRPMRGASNAMIFGNGGYLIAGTRQSSGVIAICGANGYYNGTLQGTVTNGWDSVGIEIAIGNLNYQSGEGRTILTNSSFDGRIQAIAFYRDDISPYIPDLTTAMNAL